MQFTGARDRFEFAPDFRNPYGDHAPVGLYLRFTWAAEETEPAPLPLQMGPGSYQPTALIVEMRQFNLQHTLTSLRTLAEYLQNQAGSVNYLGVPGFFQRSLLYRRQCGIDTDDIGILLYNQLAEALDRAFAEIRAGMNFGKRHRFARHNVQIDRGGQPDRFVEA